MMQTLSCGCVAFGRSVKRAYCGVHQMWADVVDELDLSTIEPIVIPKILIHSKKTMEAMREWLDFRKPDPFWQRQHSTFGDIPVIVDERVPEGKLRIYPDPDSDEYQEFDLR